MLRIPLATFSLLYGITLFFVALWVAGISSPPFLQREDLGGNVNMSVETTPFGLLVKISR